MAEKKNSNTNSVQSVLRACAILECLCSGTGNLTDIARQLKLSYSTTHRLLKTLEAAGMATQEMGGHVYYPGPVFTRIGTDLPGLHQNIVAHAVEEMERLWKLSRETVALFILAGKHKILLKEMQSNYELRFVTEQTPVHIFSDPGGIGKTLLSLLSDAEFDSIVENSEPAARQNLFEQPDKIKSEIQQIRRDGYFLGHKKDKAGAVTVSAPIKNYVYPAVVSIIGPEYRMLPNAEEYMREVKKSAVWISSHLA